MLPVRDDIEDIPGVWAWDNGGGYLLRELHFSCGVSIILVSGEGICSIMGVARMEIDGTPVSLRIIRRYVE